RRKTPRGGPPPAGAQVELSPPDSAATGIRNGLPLDPARDDCLIMLADRIEGKWIDAFCEIFASCAVKQGDTAAILSETQSVPLNVELAELALLRLGARPFHIVVH